jgi:hypothetical protein
MGRRLLTSTGPEHAETAFPFLPFPDEGTGGGGAGGDGDTDPDDDDTDDDTGDDGGDDDGGAKDWKAEARKWEARARADAKKAERAAQDADRLRKASMTDAERSVATAREEGERAGLAKASEALVTAHLEAALAHLDDGQREALVEGVNAARFLGDDGLPDKTAIRTWADRVAPKPTGGGQQFPNLGQGRRAPAKTTDMNELIRRAAGV